MTSISRSQNTCSQLQVRSMKNIHGKTKGKEIGTNIKLTSSIFCYLLTVLCIQKNYYARLLYQEKLSAKKALILSKNVCPEGNGWDSRYI